MGRRVRTGGAAGAGGCLRGPAGPGGRCRSRRPSAGEEYQYALQRSARVVRALPEWMPIYNRCLSSAQTLANQQPALGLRARSGDGFARALPGAAWSAAALHSRAVSSRPLPQGKL